LNLYVAVSERSALDWMHGVDAFFWWQDVYVTFDISLKPVEAKNLKADFLVNPEDFEPSRLDSLGKQIAWLLKERNRCFRYNNPKLKTFESEEVD
jgi:hypothetical protein